MNKLIMPFSLLLVLSIGFISVAFGENVYPQVAEKRLVKPGVGECIGKIVDACDLDCAPCVFINCTDGSSALGCTNENEMNNCQFTASDNCIKWDCDANSKEACFAERVESTIGSKSCQTAVSFLFYVFDFVPEKEIEIEYGTPVSAELNGEQFVFQIEPEVHGEKCPLKVRINSEEVDVPGVGMIVKVPPEGIEFMPVSVTTDYINNTVTAKLALKKMAKSDDDVSFVQPSLTIWGQFLAWLGFIQV